MSELEEKVARLEGQLEAQKEIMAHQPPEDLDAKVNRSRSYLGWIQAIAALVAVVIGLGVNWGMTKAELTNVQTQITEIKEDRDKKEELYKEKTEKVNKQVLELQLRDAADTQWKANVTQQLQAILEKLEN